ncbi:type 4 prepilin peptidase 1 [Azomonas agilis]|uniref:Prepilin leader peptidase/N-methyltransferase n=1 Tax=Azomonas agilis TaxID=116849 RepID=A0A562IZP8_9GAMM|nr:A24 family peptidase [Azomonas agilis]TWH76320.1 type 4 prepilin peptidase 1 [Azomonas agilis]
MAVLDLLAQSTPWLIAVTLLLGLMVGSFLNVLVYRLPLMMQREWRIQAREILDMPAQDEGEPFNLCWPGSRCPHCGHRIRLWENIPLLSWLLLRGRCSSCAEPISLRYPLVELACGLLSAGLAAYLGWGWPLLLMLVLTWGLLALSLIDWDHQLLPDSLVLPLLWLGLVANAFEVFVPFSEAFWGAVIGYLLLWSVYWLFKLITGKEGMGQGDFKLLALLGAWGGWQILPLVILLSSLTGSILGVVLLRLRGQDRHTPFPFGPFLAIAGWIAVLWGQPMTAFYFNLVGF